MDFSDVEIELAKQLKEAGLEWKPQNGDYYLDEYGDIEFLTPEIMNWWLTGYYHYSLPISKKVQLPLWHQCREILREAGYHIELTESSNHLVLKFTKDGKQGYVTANTDLEAMYKALDIVTAK